MNVRRSVAFVVALLIAAPLAAQQTPAQKAAADAEFLKGAYVAGAEGVTSPVLLKEVKPRYTADAMREKLQGQVEIQVVVGGDGKVERARVIQSLDTLLGLDDAALAAAKAWVFKPGTKDGQPVPVVVNLMLEFRLH
jgi:periplasmic protein TonB